MHDPHATVVIPNSTANKVLDDLTFTNGPGTYFILIAVKDGYCPSIMSSLDPESMNKLMEWILERRERREVEILDTNKESFKKGN